MKPPKISRYVCLVVMGVTVLTFIVASRSSPIEMLTVLGACLVVAAWLVRMCPRKKKGLVEPEGNVDE